MQTIEELIQKYDYDAALRLLREKTEQTASVKAALAARIEALKQQCIRQDPEHIPHIFFHSLLADPERAFSNKENDFDKWMITVREFHRILDELYSRGYVLVRLHDICYEVTDPESGRKEMVYGDILLPKGKKALVISQDDLCYYEYQSGCGLAQRIIPGKDGGLTCEYIDASGAMLTGNYDLVPILDDFIKKHPDFSYRGARAVLGFTGYNGILGYRTDESYSPASSYYDPEMEDSPNDNIAEDRDRAVEILKMLADEGYELASHSWGHRDMSTVPLDGFQRDTVRWARNVQELIRKAVGEPSDIYIFPFGSDIGAVGGYERDRINADGLHPDGYARFTCLQEQGFRYYCNVDCSGFVQKGEDYFRMGRIDIDGLQLWNGALHPEKSCLSEFMDVLSVFDPVRLNRYLDRIS